MRKVIVSLTLITCVACSLLILSSIVNAAAKPLDFGGIVKLIESHYRVKSKGLPLVARMGIKVASPVTRIGGYGGIKVALFEDQDFSSPMKGVGLGEVLRGALLPEWSPLVEVRSRQSSELTLVYTKESGDRFKVLVVTISQRDGTAVQAELSKSKLAQLIKDPERMSRKMTDEAASENETEQ